jgi:hypothetical protein
MAEPKETKEVELRSDGWQRFERAVDAAVKSGPKHRASKKQAKVESHLKAIKDRKTK